MSGNRSRIASRRESARSGRGPGTGLLPGGAASRVRILHGSATSAISVNWLANYVMGHALGASSRRPAGRCSPWSASSPGPWSPPVNMELVLRPARQPMFYFVMGFLMMNFGLILGSCPIRIGDPERVRHVFGLVGWVSTIGVVLGSVAMRWQARRYAERMAQCMTAAVATLVFGFVLGYLAAVRPLLRRRVSGCLPGARHGAAEGRRGRLLARWAASCCSAP